MSLPADGKPAAPRSEPTQVQDARIPHASGTADSNTPGAAVRCGTGFFPARHCTQNQPGCTMHRAPQPGPKQLAPPFRPRLLSGQVSVAMKALRRRPGKADQDLRQLSSAVEQRFCKPWVVGSIPTAGSIFNCMCSRGLGSRRGPLSAELSADCPREPLLADNSGKLR